MHVSQRLAQSQPLATTAMHGRVEAPLAFGAAWHAGGA